MKKLIVKKQVIILAAAAVIVLLPLIFFGKAKYIADPNKVVKYEPAMNYEDGSTKKMLNSVEKRKPLSEADKKIRDAITNDMQNPLSETDAYLLEYLSEPDQFMVEIRSTDIDGTKNQVKQWFNSQGISDEGICKLPVVFYMNPTAAEAYRNKNVEFNPLPIGC